MDSVQVGQLRHFFLYEVVKDELPQAGNVKLYNKKIA